MHGDDEAAGPNATPATAYRTIHAKAITTFRFHSRPPPRLSLGNGQASHACLRLEPSSPDCPAPIGFIFLRSAIGLIDLGQVRADDLKRHLTGNGRAPKNQMQRAIKATLGLSAMPEPPDLADALAIALCCGAKRRVDQVVDGREGTIFVQRRDAIAIRLELLLIEELVRMRASLRRSLRISELQTAYKRAKARMPSIEVPSRLSLMRKKFSFVQVSRLRETRDDLSNYWTNVRHRIRRGRLEVLFRIDRMALNLLREVRLTTGFLIALATGAN